jgi:4-amino-4-deoxy-L-arabinose transferase-like glycosyltransferase
MSKHFWIKYSHIILIILVVILGIFLRFYLLNEIPGEMWADIVDGRIYTGEILQGRWPMYYVLGNGPLFFYFVALLSLFFSLNFFVLKMTSAFFGVLLILGSYLIAREVSNKKIAVLTAFLVGVSKWSLIYSRLGNMNILVPVFIAFIFYFLFRAIKNQKKHDFLVVGILTGIGLYNYPAFLFVPITLGIFLLYFLIYNRRFIKSNLMAITMSIAIFLIFFIPFSRSISQFGFFDSNSYFGSKFFTRGNKLPTDFLQKVIKNSLISFGVFNFKGDPSFRVNVGSQSQLDLLSGIFFWVGIFYCIKIKNIRKNAFFILLPVFTLQLPAILVVNVPSDIPSATRSIGILPFVYLLIAMGIYSVIDKINGKYRKIFITSGILVAIFIVNFNNVFITYPKGLPNNNTPFDRIIAQEIDNLAMNIKVNVVDCCWGEWGQPDPRAIKFNLRKKRDVNFINKSVANSACNELIPLNGHKVRNIFITAPENISEQGKISSCFPHGQARKIYTNGFAVAWIYSIPSL